PVAAQSRRLYSVLAFLVLERGALLVVWRWVVPAGDDWLSGFLGISLSVLATMLLGDSVHSRRAYYAELEARAQRLEREREQEAQLAVAAERARIAREMHDVVAHNVSVMVVQAEGAAYLMDVDPGRSRAAVETVASAGRRSPICAGCSACSDPTRTRPTSVRRSPDSPTCPTWWRGCATPACPSTSR